MPGPQAPVSDSELQKALTSPCLSPFYPFGCMKTASYQNPGAVPAGRLRCRSASACAGAPPLLPCQAFPCLHLAAAGSEALVCIKTTAGMGSCGFRVTGKTKAPLALDRGPKIASYLCRGVMGTPLQPRESAKQVEVQTSKRDIAKYLNRFRW